MTEDRTIEHIAPELVGILGSGRQRDDLVVRDMPTAYRIVSRVRSLREARGERVVGRKIGFTNTTIWKTYGVDAPMWNYVWDTTVSTATSGTARLDLAGMPEPRIEPEVVLHLCRGPEPGMDEEALLDCVDQVAHGCEIVQSIFPRWRFTGPSSAAAFGLHGRLVVGPWRDIRNDRLEWSKSLADFSVTLRQAEAVVDEGHARNVLGGPISALRHLVMTIADDPSSPPLQPGEIVTTGTLTDAHPVSAGQAWSTEIDGTQLPGLRLAFA